MKRNVLAHILIWLVLSALYFFLVSEPVARMLPEDVQGVETWLLLTTIGLILIFLLVLISFTITTATIMRKQKQKV